MEHLVVTEIIKHGYFAVFVLMILESACVPVPSEAIMGVGGALAGGLVVAGVDLDLNVIAIALLGAAGNLVGAMIAYGVGRSGGRPLIDRWGRYVLLRQKEIDRAERFFAQHGRSAVFFGRLVPVVRTFISLPAGVAEMPAVPFAVLTAAGSLPWTFGLAFAGYALASNWKSVTGGFTPATVAIAVLILAAIAWWMFRQLRASGDRARGV